MQPLIQAFPVLAIAVVYCLYNKHYLAFRKRQTRLRERVAYMLWTAAQQDELELTGRE